MPYLTRRFLPLSLVLAILLPLGCSESLPPTDAEPADSSSPALASQFDPRTATTLRGRVTWNGDLPQVPQLEVPAFVAAGERGKPHLWRDNPHAPLIDPTHHGIANAVVYLKGIHPAQSRHWHHAAVILEQQQRSLVVVQGSERSYLGFVRRGDYLEMVSSAPQFHSLHLNGAAFFTLAFPDPDQPLRRKLTRAGHVECSSAAGYFWMRAHLFVDDHPYYARTDSHGDFVLEQVPPGAYELVCWLPNWIEQSRDLDPETALTLRLRFRPPVTLSQRVTVPTNGPVEFTCALSRNCSERSRLAVLPTCDKKSYFSLMSLRSRPEFTNLGRATCDVWQCFLS